MRVLGRRTPAVVAAAALGLSVLVGSGAATAGHHHGPAAVPPPPAVPTSASQIQNIDQVKTAIKGYYGDRIDPDRVNPIDGSPLHTFDPAGSYAHEVGRIARRAEKTLADRHLRHQSGKPRAVLFDVDDTLLNTYSYEIYSSFVYNPTSNAAFVNSGVFRAVPHMVALEHWAESHGYAIFFLTGRPETQRAGTVSNLVNEGYDVTSSRLFLKDYGVDTWLSPCASACTTTQYKSLTRKHIEDDLGYRIVGNFGDQYSDLLGGYADRTFKIPNPMYYLP
ncbi:MAG: HAD family acid phosphatase [Marmoricola sp.]